MGTISGKEFIDRINQLKTKFGLMVKKLTERFRSILPLKEFLKSKSSLYDLQKDRKFKR